MNKDDLEKHIEYIHDGINKHRCEVCSKCFNSKDIMDQHMLEIMVLSVQFVKIPQQKNHNSKFTYNLKHNIKIAPVSEQA